MESLTRTCCYALMLLVVAAVVAAEGSGYEYDEDLSLSYYRESCPQLEKIVHNKLKLWLRNDSTLSPALINLHYRDCAVRVCVHHPHPSLLSFIHHHGVNIL